MAAELRKSGIETVGDMPWGTHFCHFYETKEDLLDILLPYFKMGLENNEFCMWIVYKPLNEADARNALRRAIPEADRHLAAGDIEIVSHTQWYLKGGAFDLQRVVNDWHEKLAQALSRGYEGMRGNGNEAWLTERDWRDFAAYEKKLNEMIARQRMIVLCTYPLSITRAAELFDVARTHQFAVVKRQGNWEVVETPALRQAKAEINRLNEELEQKVIERTGELAACMEDLREEIAERARTDEVRLISEERFRRYFELGLIGMAITSPTKAYLEVNDQICSILGYERSELLQKTWAELTHPDDLLPQTANFDRILAGEIDGYSMEKRFIRKDGQVVYAMISVKALRRADGSVDSFVTLLQDITERRRTEEALQKSEEELRMLFAAMTDIVLVLDAEGRYVKIAPTNHLNLYRPPEELLEKRIHQILPKEDADRILQQIERTLEGHQTINFEYKLDIGSREVWFEGRISPYAENTVLWIARDITEQKKAEKEKAVLQEQLQRVQKMEAIGTLAGGIAHDFNNILAAILGYVELANLDAPEGSKVKYNLQEGMKSILRAKDLVHQILAFSRQGTEERKPLDIKPIIQDGLKFLRASLPSTVEIRQEGEEDLGMIKADPTQVHQVLMNLCTNAAHAMEGKGGVLSISVNKMDMEGEAATSAGIEPGPYVRLRVSDTGHGIPAEIRERIFDPYFTTKEVGKGTGLGLAVVHGIVKSYGGGIAVSSEVGKGSTFEIYFPRIEAAELPPVAGKVQPLPLGGHERVLFVDDEKAIAEIGREVLEHLGYEVVVRTSSIEALELFRAKPDQFDLVITDMTMPNMTGDRLAQELIRIRPGIPIILSTGFSEHITEERAKALGIREFVMKPLIMTELATAMRKALESRKKKKG